MKTFFREILITLALAVVVFFIIQTTVQTFVVMGASMEPSLHDRQRLLVNKAVYYLSEPERGDVIVFKLAKRQADYVKRIIALPGDTVEVKTGVVYVNGSPLEESYIKNPPSYTIEQQKILGNTYFVLGDNRDNSDDSHNGWVVPHQNIIGKAWLLIWPPNEWGLVPNYPLQEQLVGAVSK